MFFFSSAFVTGLSFPLLLLVNQQWCHRSGFEFQTALLSVLFVMFQAQLSFLVNRHYFIIIIIIITTTITSTFFTFFIHATCQTVRIFSVFLRIAQTNHRITQGRNGLFSARNWPDHQGIRIADVGTTEGIVYNYIQTVTNTSARQTGQNFLRTGQYLALSSCNMWSGRIVHKTWLNKTVTRKATTELSTMLQLEINAVFMNWTKSIDAAWDKKR